MQGKHNYQTIGRIGKESAYLGMLLEKEHELTNHHEEHQNKNLDPWDPTHPPLYKHVSYYPSLCFFP